jgi:hypothetical protein
MIKAVTGLGLGILVYALPTPDNLTPEGTVSL